MDLITIIVPVYNVDKYINECVDSLINQTYKNIEIILIDDGSKDKSGMICDDYVKRDARIKVIHKNNEGLGFARNSGLNLAQGRFVTFIDSDDRAEPDLIENLVREINESECDTCIGGFKRISEYGTFLYEEKYSEKVYKDNAVYDELFAQMLGSAPDKHDAIRMSVWNTMYSMEIIKKYKIEFPSERKLISEDIIWDSEYYKHAKCAKVICSTSYNYRVTPGSLTKKYDPDRLDKICTLYLELSSRIAADEDKIRRLQRQFFVNVRECINQERYSLSNKDAKEIQEAIRNIVENQVVCMVSNEYVHVIRQWKQKVFVMAVKYKCVSLLSLIISKRRL